MKPTDRSGSTRFGSRMLKTAALGGGALHRAADAYDRAARQPYGRVPAPTPAGNQLRHAARLLRKAAKTANSAHGA